MAFFEIGTKVFYFDDSLKGDLEIKESVVYGSFVSRKTGDVYYYLKEKQVPGYCVWNTKEGIHELLIKFEAYRQDYIKRIEEQTERFNNFKAMFNVPELQDTTTEE